jgi:hypothetical protein
MPSQRFVVCTLVGGIVSFVLGGLIYAVVLVDFFNANLGSATGSMRDPALMWAVAVSELAGAALLTLFIGSRGRTPSLGDGVQIGAAFGLIVSIFMDFNLYGTTNFMNLTATVVDPLIGAARFAITGGVIGWLAGRK